MHRKHDISKPFWTPFSWDEEGDWDFSASDPSGLSVYEENDFVYIEASLPGLSTHDVEVYQDHGIIIIEGKREEEKKERKYYRKASAAFRYQVPIPSSVEKETEPEATYKDGLLKLKFKKVNKKKKNDPNCIEMNSKIGFSKVSK